MLVPRKTGRSFSVTVAGAPNTSELHW